MSRYVPYELKHEPMGDFIVGPNYRQNVEVGGYIFTALDATHLQNEAYAQGVASRDAEIDALKAEVTHLQEGLEKIGEGMYHCSKHEECKAGDLAQKYWNALKET